MADDEIEGMEREAAEMERQSEELGEQVDEARAEWEAAKEDPAVPGAAGDPDRAEEGPAPEATYPTKRPDED